MWLSKVCLWPFLTPKSFQHLLLHLLILPILISTLSFVFTWEVYLLALFFIRLFASQFKKDFWGQLKIVSLPLCLNFNCFFFYLYIHWCHTDESWEGWNTCLWTYALNLFIEQSREHWLEQNIFCSFTTSILAKLSTSVVLVTSVVLYLVAPIINISSYKNFFLTFKA